MPLCLPRQIHSLRFLSTASVLAIFFTTACVVGLAFGERPRTPDAEEAWRLVKPPSGSWALATPIHSLAYCSQFQVFELANDLPASQRHLLPGIVHIAMAVAAAIYALVGTTGYVLLGERAALYPNILTAFGYDRTVLMGSAAIAIVNVLKLPLLVLPLRSLLLEQLHVPPLGALSHGMLTVALVGLLGSVASATHDLAYAFQLSGCTAGTMVCFCLPGLLLFGAHRLARQRETLLHMTTMADPPRSSRIAALLPTWSECAGLLMGGVGAMSGLVCLVVLLA